jgi:hypothetical protein
MKDHQLRALLTAILVREPEDPMARFDENIIGAALRRADLIIEKCPAPRSHDGDD